MRFRPFALATPLVALALVVAPVLADAPPDQYNPYVRTDLEIGDAKTFLSWRRSFKGDVDFSSASAVAVTCANTQGVTYRLPTMKELLTLVDELPHNEYEDGALVPKAIDRSAFPGTPAAAFWSGTVYALDPSKAWVVDFKTGAARPVDKTEKHYVRCVR